MRGLILGTAKTLLPRARLVLKPDVESLVDALCSGEIDALFADSRSVQRHLIDRRVPCPSLKLKIVRRRLDAPFGTVSTRTLGNRADPLFARINEIVADGTLANLASTYTLATPDSKLQLAQLVQSRQSFLLLQAACLALGSLLVVFVLIGMRMRAARRAVEEARLNLEEERTPLPCIHGSPGGECVHERQRRPDGLYQ